LICYLRLRVKCFLILRSERWPCPGPVRRSSSAYIRYAALCQRYAHQEHFNRFEHIVCFFVSAKYVHDPFAMFFCCPTYFDEIEWCSMIYVTISIAIFYLIFGFISILEYIAGQWLFTCVTISLAIFKLIFGFITIL